MKFSNTITQTVKTGTITGPLNVISLSAVSMIWGHMLGLLNLWFLPLTVLLFCIGYGSEINKPLPTKLDQ